VGEYLATEVVEGRNLNYTELMKEMKSTNRTFDQFRQFRDHQEELECRQTEMAQSEHIIIELIRQLDHKKWKYILSLTQT
jgi:hypothetical protein